METSFAMHRLHWFFPSLVAIAFVQGTLVSARPFRTVQEHFLGIPTPLLPFSIELRRNFLEYSLVDQPNGYIRYQASDNPLRFEFAIFRKRNGQYLAAFSTPYDPDSFPDQPVPSQLVLLDYRQGQWRDVTRELLPVPFNPTLTYQLPQVGRDIMVLNRRNQVLYRLRWQNDRFYYLILP